MRPIYLISKTSYSGVIHIPVLALHFFIPEIDFDPYEGVVVTSKQAAEGLKHYSPDWNKLKVICVGESTANAMKQLGAIHVETANGYGMDIANILSSYKGKWLYLRPKMIASSWPAYAREQGLVIDEVIIYETTCNEAIDGIDIEKNAVLVFTSPSSIECFYKHTKILATHKVIVIGKTTQKALPSDIKSILSEKATVFSCIEKAHELATS